MVDDERKKKKMKRNQYVKKKRKRGKENEQKKGSRRFEVLNITRKLRRKNQRKIIFIPRIKTSHHHFIIKVEMLLSRRNRDYICD